MVRLNLWQWLILVTPIASIAIFLMLAAGLQIRDWGISWIWGIFILVFVGWRWLLVKWTRPVLDQVEMAVAAVSQKLDLVTDDRTIGVDEATKKAEAALQEILEQTRDDRPIWEDWQAFWQRCQELVVAVAQIYYPEVKYPLLNIYIPQAYALMRGTMDDLDRWMAQLSPALNQVTVGQAYQAYEVYQKLEPSARKLWKVWNWAQWLLNPVAALAKRASQRYSTEANQQLLVNLSGLLRETALRNLCRQAIALYSGTSLPPEAFAVSQATLPKAKTQTLGDIIAQAEPEQKVEQKPVNILLVGRTGSGKSSLINSLFQAEMAAVDVLPSTDRIANYHWQSKAETLTLWDSPGYEQVKRGELREIVLDYANNADLLLLVTPALDPALQMDLDFLHDMQENVKDLPVITIVTQVDRLRPVREWQPPYNWQGGTGTKESNIRAATEYRAELLKDTCDRVLPVVTGDMKTGRTAWNVEALSVALVEAIAPAKQLRLARFLRDREARTIAAAKIIDRYTFQMATTGGLTALLKSPVLQFISTISTGTPALAYVLAEKIPVEQLPVVIGKLQMAYDLFSLLNSDSNPLNFDLLKLWPLLQENTGSPERNAWAFGHALVEYWTQNLAIEQLQEKFDEYLQQV